MNNINIQLYGGDCLAVMDELIANEIKVDAVITDPPYGMKFKSNYRKNKYNNIINDKTTKWLNEFAENVGKFLTTIQHIIFFVVFII